MSNGHGQEFRHHMLREIYEQPDALRATMERYAEGHQLRHEAFGGAGEILERHKDLIIAASGSSRHAGLAAEIMLEDAAGLAVDVEYASEYITRSTNTKRHPAVMVISQSGETGDTLGALHEAQRRGHPVIAVTNVATSSMARQAEVSLPTEAGKELAIPATKSFTSQLVVLRLMSLLAAGVRDAMSKGAIAGALSNLQTLPSLIAQQLAGWDKAAEAMAREFRDAKTMLYVGRGIHYAMAREGALKLKESSYVHAEGYPTGELKHGPNALVSEQVPLIVLATVDNEDAESRLRYEKTLNLMSDMRRQGARMLAIANTGDAAVASLAQGVIEVAPCEEALLPIAEVVPLQLFAYYTALEHGVDVDRPRNLVKSVVVE